MPGAKEPQDTLDGNAFVLKRAWQSAWTVLIDLDRVPFVKLRQLLRSEFSIGLRAVTFPIQRRIGPTDVEASHLRPPNAPVGDAVTAVVQEFKAISPKCRCKRQKRYHDLIKPCG
jgi:hypothetical protein